MKFNKNAKILTAIIAPTVALATAGVVVATILVKNNKPHIDPVEHKDFTIIFDAGEGRFASGQSNATEVYAGTHFDEVEQPVVTADGKYFAGWVDEQGKPVIGRQTVHSNMRLKAKYANAATGEYALVTFNPGDTGAVVQGNIRIAVNKGYFFFMINRPSVKHETKLFKNWKYASGSKSGQIVRENDVISEDVTLVPQLANSVSITWNGNGATKIRGADKTYVESGTIFNKANQPTFENGNKLFEGWYKEQSCTNRWSATDSITADSTAWAKWIDTPSDTYCSITYIQKPGTDVTPIFSPASSQVVLKTTTWQNIIKPTVTSATGNHKVDHWEYSVDGTSNWTTLTDATAFTTLDSVYIAPILTYNVENVYVFGANTVMTQKQTTFEHYVVGSTTKDVIWRVYDDETCQTQSSVATISSDGVLSVGYVGVENRKIYVQATSTVDATKVSDPFEVTIQLPYIDSSDIWYSSNNEWYSISMDNITDTTSTFYTARSLSSGTITSVTKSISFTNKIYIGRDIKVIPENFMCGFSGFNGELDFEATATNSKNNVVEIQNSFLEGCMLFNQHLDLSNIKYIGDNFLYDCNKFNNGGSTNPLDLSNCTSLKTIGSNFLGNCYNFNQEIKLPSTGLVQIGEFFLFNCLRFNSPIALPATITTINPFFMLNCNSFASTLTVNCNPTCFKGNKNQICATSQTWDDPETPGTVETYTSEIFNTGFTVAGTYITEFKATFETTGSGTIWRTVK